MNTGRMLEGQEDFAGAIKQYQSALAIVGWWDNQAGFGVTSDSLRDLIEDVRHKAAVKERAVQAEQIRRGQVERERDLAREREERLGRIRAYFRDADLAYHAGEWARARADLVMVLQQDPQNGGALRMKVMIDEAEHQANWRMARQRFDEEWKSVMEQFQDAIQPQVDVVEFPKNWGEIVKRTARSVGDVSAPADIESKAAIMAILESKRVKGLTFTDANLDAVVQYLRTVTGLNFHITPKVRATKFDDVKVNIGLLDNVSVAEVLTIITSTADLRWEPRDGVVTISLKEEVAGTLRLRYFDVKDLAVKIQNFRGTEIFLAPSNYTPPEPPELPEPVAIFPEEQLVDTIKSVVDPESWAVEGASLEVKNKLLIAKNTADTLDRVGEMLAELRSNSGPLVHLEVRFITIEDNFLRDVGVDVRGLGDNSQGQGVPGLGASVPQDDIFFGSPANPQGGPLGIHPEPSSSGTSNDSGVYYNDGADGGYQARVENLFDTVLGNPQVMTGSGGMAFQHTFLDDTQLEVILRAVEKSERIQTITASQITVWNTQRATVEVLNKVAYVGDYDVEIAQAANIANPIIKHAVDGVVLDVKPVVSGDRRFVTLELRPTVATLVRPIPTFSTSLDSNIAPATVVIQVPKLQKSTVRTTVTMPDGGTLLLGGLKFYEQVDATSEVPILGQLPVLSFLFSRKGHYVNKRNLIILITARIVALEEMEPTGEFTPIPLPLNVPVVPAPEPDLCPPIQVPCAPPPPKAPCGCPPGR
jgi:type II secretory pathway component GspD/PulD (secretin)